MSFHEIEDHRDLTAGLEHESLDDFVSKWADDRIAALEGLSEDRLQEIAAYAMLEPEFYDRMVDVWDGREGK